MLDNDLLSHGKSILPSAKDSFTAEFGMDQVVPVLYCCQAFILLMKNGQKSILNNKNFRFLLKNKSYL